MRISDWSSDVCSSDLDIPFAAAPVGALRWRAPQAPPRWRGVRDAAKLGPACPQTVRPALVAGGVAEHQAGACLQLNIWRPAGARKLPVMVWRSEGRRVGRERVSAGSDWGAPCH